MKIFYSWQLDTPRKSNKDFIHDALELAVKKLSKEASLDDAERPQIEIDQDTKGVRGSPAITEVIFEKIANCDVLVVDVSLVARGKDDKPHINSNVAIELGFGYGKIGYEPILKIMNTRFGSPDQLPFDLRSRRFPVTYSLDPNPTREQVHAQLEILASKLAPILSDYFAASSTSSNKPHVEVGSVNLRGQFWQPAEPLVPKASRPHLENDILWAGSRILYFRCIPTIELPRLEMAEVDKLSADLQPLVSSSGWSRSRNKWGMIVHDNSPDGSRLIGATQVFRNREIWAVDTTHAEAEKGLREGGSFRFIPTGALQREYPRAIDAIRKTVDALGYGNNCVIEMGLSGADGMYLAIDPRHFEAFPGPFYENEIFIRKVLPRDYPTGMLLNDFWAKLFGEISRPVPRELIFSA